MKRFFFFFLFLFFVTIPSTFASDGEKMCTREYAPVCGEIQVQCITTPCPPIRETYGNSCMAENAGANILWEGECNIADSLPPVEDDAIMCPMIYAPVCGEDGVTYGNSCMAQKISIKYEGTCIEKIQERKFEYQWNKKIPALFAGISLEKKKTILEQAEIRIEKKLESINISEEKKSIYNFLKYLIQKTASSLE